MNDFVILNRKIKMRRLLSLPFLLAFTIGLFAQDDMGKDQKHVNQLTDNVQYEVEMQGSFSSGKEPLWLHSNRYGLSSIEKSNGFLRTSVTRPLQTDSLQKWGIGYGVDIAIPYHFTSHVVLQQAFLEARYKKVVLSVGSKEYPMELKNNVLSSGSQTFGINARPVPQVRLALPEYIILPFGNSWLRVKGHIAYGRMTDDNWQHQFTNYQSKYVDNTLYHSKAGYLMIGNPDGFYPFSVEVGLEMATLFGGTAHFPQSNGTDILVQNATNLKAYWNAFMPGGNDVIENNSDYKNVEGDQLGSWTLRLNYDADSWKLGFYGDKFFEDHSSMLQLDYDGYGQGENWDVKEKRRFFLYDLKDILLGTEVQLKYGSWLQNIVVEYLYSEYQSGPIYHDHTINMSDHIGGDDNFYNHGIYTGWQHWGEVMGNPLYLSPIYNEDGNIIVKNNRLMAFHLGISGEPFESFLYRVLATYQEGFGTYDLPFTSKRREVNCLLEAGYHFMNGWQVRGSYGMDLGKIMGNNTGFQLSVSKSGILNRHKRRK